MHHAEIADFYVDTIARSLQEFQTGNSVSYRQMPEQTYTDLAWFGLVSTPVFTKHIKSSKMKNILFLTFSLFLISCSIKKSKESISQQESVFSSLSNLSKEESNIVNDFLEIELKSEQYKSYKNLETILAEEALNQTYSLNSYEYAYNEWHKYNKENNDLNEQLGWVIDDKQLQELKLKYTNNKPFYWRKNDIKNYNITIIKNEVLKNGAKTGTSFDKPERLVLYISRPLMINQNQAFLNFISSNSMYGNMIHHFTILMKKNNNKWVEGPTYGDGSFQ